MMVARYICKQRGQVCLTILAASQEDPLIPVRSPVTSSVDNSNDFWV